MTLLLLMTLLTSPLKDDLQQIHIHLAKQEIQQGLTLIKKTLTPLKNHPATGGTISLYRRICQQHNIDPRTFLNSLLKQRTTPHIRERIHLTLGEHYQSLGLSGFYHAIYHYEMIFFNPAEHSKVLDEALWNTFLIYKKIKAFRAAEKILDRIINTETYAIYTGSYNQFHLYDAYLEKAAILKRYHQQKKRINLLKRFVTTYRENNRRPEGLYLLCLEGEKRYCQELKHYPYNRFARRLKGKQ